MGPLPRFPCAALTELGREKQLKRIISLATVAVAAVAAALWLAVPAGASPGRSAVSGTEHFRLMSTSGTSNTASVIATGVFTAGGVARSGTPAGTFVFPAGSFKVVHSKGTGTQTFNRKTCLLTVNLKGTYKIFGGTGKYAGISGSGKYQLSILAVAARSAGKCTTQKALLAFQQIVKFSGPVSL
jgi:hypothetical protein